jgi:hypothetical protein
VQLGQASLSSHLLHHAPCPTLVIPFKSLSSDGSMQEALPPAAIGDHVAAEISPREAGPDASPAAPASAAAPPSMRCKRKCNVVFKWI